jgi:uncharacterized protein
MRPDGVVLEGITGSIAYGLDRAESDVDLKGVFVAPVDEILGLNSVRETIDHTDPDFSYHELGKFCRLALAGNPTILEQLFLYHYTYVKPPVGTLLRHNRAAFLSNAVRKTYGGYAMQQARRLETRAAAGDASFSSKLRKRYSKHARHCYRLLLQGAKLLTTGTLTVRVQNPEEIFAVGEMPHEEFTQFIHDEFAKFDALPSVLPDKPDFELVNQMVVSIRRQSI